MRSFLNAYLDNRIVVFTVPTFRGRSHPKTVNGTLLSVSETTLKLRTEIGDQVIALDHLVEFRPWDSSRLPDSVKNVREAASKTIVLEWYDKLQKMLKEREPEEKIRPLLGKVIHGAGKLLAKGEDSELAVARERCEFILRKCSDPSLPPEE